MRLRTPIAPLPDGRYRLRLDAGERRLVRGLCDELDELIRADDAGVARLFPPGHRDDDEAAEEFSRLVHPGLREERLASLEVVTRSLDADTLTQVEAEAWCGALNDLRLVLGERLGVTEDLDLGAMSLLRHPQARELALYGWLTAVQGAAVEALASRL
jgi:hypothetical protein